MKITTEIIQAAYSASADVYDKKISTQQAINDLKTKFSWDGMGIHHLIVLLISRR
jgi:hypothetical protein